MGFRSIKEIFVVGHGPSSSHTMGPYFATQYIINKYKEKGIKKITVTLYGSLALTGKGHLTDEILMLGLRDYRHDVCFDYTSKKKHPNTMTFEIETEKGKFKEDVLSIGGGSIVTKDNVKELKKSEIYPHSNMKEIVDYCNSNFISLYDYVARFEDPDIQGYFENVLRVMDEAVERGLLAEGLLPGKLHVRRKAKSMYEEMINTMHSINDVTMNVAIHAFAVAEENASGGIIVTSLMLCMVLIISSYIDLAFRRTCSLPGRSPSANKPLSTASSITRRTFSKYPWISGSSNLAT